MLLKRNTLNMLFDSSIELVLEEFQKKPTDGLQVREIIRLTELGNPTVIRALKTLLNMKLIKKVEGRIYPYYEADLESLEFKKIKIAQTTIVLDQIINEANKKNLPKCIVLFDSASKGNDTEKNNIELFMQCKKVDIDTKSVEKILERKINITFESNTKKISKEFLNRLANGIVLSGYLEVSQ